MFNVIKKQGETLYQHTESGIIYELFKGGISWPGILSGFVCVIGEKHEEGTLRLFEETHFENMDDLAKRLGTLQNLYHIDYWVANREGSAKGFEDILDDIGRTKDKTFRISQADFANDLKLALQVIRRQFNQNALDIPQGGILQSRLEQLDKSDISEPGLIEKFPEVMVLTSVIYEFDTISNRIEKRRPKDAWGDWMEDDGGSNSWMAA